MLLWHVTDSSADSKCAPTAACIGSSVCLRCHVSIIRGWTLSAVLHRQAHSALPPVCAAFADVHGFGMALARSRCYSHTAQEGLSLNTGDGVAFIWCHRHFCQPGNDTRTDPWMSVKTYSLARAYADEKTCNTYLRILHDTCQRVTVRVLPGEGVGAPNWHSWVSCS